jgi:hypothetical protein
LILDPRQFDLVAHHAEEIELATSLTGSVENLQIFGIGKFVMRWFNSCHFLLRQFGVHSLDNKKGQSVKNLLEIISTTILSYPCM